VVLPPENTMNIQPIKILSLKDQCIARLEELILSGELKIGERLPAERDLAARLEVSRPVLHEALVDLTAKGLVRINPRHGVYVNDYRLNGSVVLLESLLAYQQGQLDPAMLQSMLDMRILLETETARLAALRRTPENLQALQDILAQESAADCQDIPTLTRLDFEFHLQIALASGNLIYPLIVNSFKSVYTSYTGAFFQKYAGCPAIAEVLAFHAEVIEAVQTGNQDAAAHIMQQMLQHGERLLKQNPEHPDNPVYVYPRR
jgi:GntR family transcriptional repressor for pyruvate dehydrogenase complex